MTDFFTMPGGTANLPDSSRSAMSYVQPPGTTTSKPDDGAMVRFNTIDWEARAKAAADGAEGLREAMDALREAGAVNYFGNLVEGDEVYARLRRLVNSWRQILQKQAESLLTLETNCRSASAALSNADSDCAEKITT